MVMRFCLSLFFLSSFLLFIFVKTGQNRSIHQFVPPKAVTCLQHHVLLPTVNIGNGKDQVGGNSDRSLAIICRSLWIMCIE